jgi:hypothetical protein
MAISESERRLLIARLYRIQPAIRVTPGRGGITGWECGGPWLPQRCVELHRFLERRFL